MDEHKDKAAQRSTAEIDTLSNRLHDTSPLAERPVYRRVLRPDGCHVMITTFPPDWWAGLAARPKATGGTAHVEITPIRPLPLPELCDPARIDAWFTEHFVKHWGMTEGFGARFTALEGDLLRFQFLVDHRFRGNRWSACAHIAQCYSRTIPVLMGATRFQAEELRAIDILGFLGSMVTDEDHRELLIECTRIAWAHLPTTPSAIHEGVIPSMKVTP